MAAQQGPNEPGNKHSEFPPLEQVPAHPTRRKEKARGGGTLPTAVRQERRLPGTQKAGDSRASAGVHRDCDGC